MMRITKEMFAGGMVGAGMASILLVTGILIGRSTVHEKASAPGVENLVHHLASETPGSACAVTGAIADSTTDAGMLICHNSNWTLVGDLTKGTR